MANTSTVKSVLRPALKTKGDPVEQLERTRALLDAATEKNVQLVSALHEERVANDKLRNELSRLRSELARAEREAV